MTTESTSGGVNIDNDGKLKLHGYDLDIGTDFDLEQRQKFIDLLQKHQDTFCKNSDDLGFTTAVKHH